MIDIFSFIVSNNYSYRMTPSQKIPGRVMSGTLVFFLTRFYPKSSRQNRVSCRRLGKELKVVARCGLDTYNGQYADRGYYYQRFEYGKGLMDKLRAGIVGSKFGVSGAGGLACMKVVEGFYHSAAEGRTIKIRQ